MRVKSGLGYHRETSYDRKRMSGHYLDWANQPAVFKTYEGLERLALPREVAFPKRSLSDLLLDAVPENAATGIDLASLSKILLLACTLTARARSREGEMFFRSAASAGALYPTEIYTATRGVDGLRDGLYHYAIDTHGLVPLRAGLFGDMCPASPALAFFLTAIFFRSAWKYRARAYRYHLLDTGHVAENLVLALKALGFSFRVTYDFDDDRVNRLLGLDTTREVALGLVFLPGGQAAPTHDGQQPGPLPDAICAASRVAATDVDYPVIRQLHDAGKQRRPGEGRNFEMREALGVRPVEWRPRAPAAPWHAIRDYPDCVFMRRSRRNFVPQALSKEQMQGLLQCLYASDGAPERESLAAGFLSAGGEETAPGFYLLDMERKSAGMVARGAFLERMARICLDQAWLANAGVHFLFLADLALLDRTWGPRGYRYAMMTAGRLGQRLYVAAEAMGLGCCGIGAFYDTEARELLGLQENAQLLYLVAVGAVRKM
jgi:SagB-type dehydrogenase family enzyme